MCHCVQLCTSYAGDDPYRWQWANLRMPESAWWRQHVFNILGVVGTRHQLFPAFEDDTPTQRHGGGWLFSAKLDWLLHTGSLRVLRRWVSPIPGGDHASDHSYVAAEIGAAKGDSANVPQMAVAPGTADGGSGDGASSSQRAPLDGKGKTS